MQFLYKYILVAVGEFGPWQASKVAVLWVFMIILGLHQTDVTRILRSPKSDQGHHILSMVNFVKFNQTSNEVQLFNYFDGVIFYL